MEEITVPNATLQHWVDYQFVTLCYSHTTKLYRGAVREGV
jgi:hypothetical protein